jgi:hypothetical protein
LFELLSGVAINLDVTQSGSSVSSVYEATQESRETDVEAHHLEPIKRLENILRRRFPLVTAAVTFTSNLEEWKGLNASYVTFASGKKGDAEQPR